MPKKKDSWIDKKNSITFRLVNRSQKDPLLVEESAPQLVLDPIIEPNNRKDEQKKYGIYYDDNYDYMKHLKGLEEFEKEFQMIEEIPSEKPTTSKSNKIMIPSSLLPSIVERKKGLLSEPGLPVGPQIDWDPDIVDALNGDFDYDNPDNQIDDDFVVQAIGEEEDDDEEEENEDGGGRNYESYHNDYGKIDRFLGSDYADYDDEIYERKSAFTNYSLTSSVIRRNEGLTSLDERFETLFEREYAEDTELGALDLDNVDGDDGEDPSKCKLLQNLIRMSDLKKKADAELDDPKSYSGFILKKIEENNDSGQEEEEEIEISQIDKDFDCESIISTYTDIYNHPKLILPKRVPLTSKNLEKLNAQMNPLQTSDTNSIQDDRRTLKSISEISFRPKDETPEARKARQAALKEIRRARRVERKCNQLAFSIEKRRYANDLINRVKNVKLV